ncbi:hypothetical protein C9374_006364 [Naegleria lovaniensis]|uniref:Uncharacterized protein n=1 Tax=Naegleria lovaniensis TaxID=51637 RepID=A0AA88GNV9_NAELO|nr:uncharacterized protein C9374_006364 [Naegleria lovaniensis]KAG2381375.1 hypothetical protein C9374_006364 [Naegleria lovaniensis]
MHPQQRLFVLLILLSIVGLGFYQLRNFTSISSSPSSKDQDLQQQQLSEKTCAKYCPKTSSMPLLTPEKPSCPPVQECKCYSLTDSPPGTDGQVTMKTSFGKALYKLAKQDDVRTVLEIGTWFGGGSTQCIAKGLQESGEDKLLYTIELYEPAWQYARKKFAHLPVRFILGGTVPTEKYLKPEEIPNHEEHFRLYYQRDIELSKKSIPWLHPLCLAFQFDAVLIDGNEYTGWAEYETIDAECKPKYLMLHDVGTLKTEKIEKTIKAGGTVWQLMEEGMDGAKWQIYKRKQ